MIKLQLSLFLLCLLFINPSWGQSISKNTNYVQTCGCPGDAWDFSVPYSPSVTFSATGFSKRAMFSDYKFNIPANATITGIKVEFMYTMNTTPGNVLRDTIVTLMHPNLQTVEDKYYSTGYINGSSGVLSYGNSTDMWGTTWTPAQINNVGFGLNFRLYANSTPADFTFTNNAPITVFYNLANGFSESQSSSPLLSVFVQNKNLTVVSKTKSDILLEVFDLTGKKVVECAFEKSERTIVDLTSLSSGVYVYCLTSENTSKTAKLILD